MLRKTPNKTKYTYIFQTLGLVYRLMVPHLDRLTPQIPPMSNIDIFHVILVSWILFGPPNFLICMPNLQISPL